MSANVSHRREPLRAEELVSWLRREGGRRYHDEHPFHRLMHEGKLTRSQLRQWIVNRYYYQSRLPIKDALIVSKSEDPEFRKLWIRRVHEHDGIEGQPGGLALWAKLAEAVGIGREDLESFRSVLPGVRFACDAYVTLVRETSLVEAVASTLTELFAPDLMTKRIAAWETHYRWVGSDALAYFRSRALCAARDAEEALAFVVRTAVTYDQQERCVTALIRKSEILWHMLDCIHLAHVSASSELPS